MKIHRSFHVFRLLFIAGVAAAEPLVVRDSAEASAGTTGLDIVSGTVDLPRKGYWFAENRYGDHDGLTEIYLVNNDDSVANDGRRSAKLKDRAATQDRSHELRRMFWNCREFARSGNGFAPEALIGLKNHYNKEEVTASAAASIHLVPGVRMFNRVDGEMVRVEEAEPILIDLAPAIDDGKHWIFDSTGGSSRVEIDTVRMEALGLVIEPQAKSHLASLKAPEPNITYKVLARRNGDPATSTFTVHNSVTKEALEVEWDTENAAEGEPSLCEEWAENRLGHFGPNLLADATAISHWTSIISEQYGLDNDFAILNNNLRGGPQRAASAMGVIGGRAAIRETLQLQNITVDDKASMVPSIPVGEIAGVEIKAHSFEEMLGDKPGGSLPLADWIPHDHFLLYLPEPGNLFKLLDSSSGFLFSSGTTVTGRSGSHGIKDRYLESFGVSETLMRRFLDTGAIEEVAATVPDLFFIDGTEVSIVLRTGRPLLTTTALALVGVPPGDGTTVKKNKHGEPVYWVRQGDILIISTHQAEVDAILAAKTNGTGLGQSHELRYMLTQVPITSETVAYTYFSDPFIRKLVGPATKIGQLRRLHARADLESASAAALLARFDGLGPESTELEYLAKHHYLRPAQTATDLVLGADLVTSSASFGTPRRMHSLTDEPVDLVSPSEKDAYSAYLANYNRFWRQFFDPIAIRYEQLPDGQHELETFILPLIENSLYGGIRQFVSADGKPLPVPVIEPTPIALLSLNLNDDAWIDLIDGFSSRLTEVLGLDGSVLDLLGPDFHVALHDADPIISMGSGELAGLFSQFSGGRSSEMFGVATLVSMLTRPCSIHIGLSDPDEVRRILTNSAWDNRDGNDIFDFAEGSLAKVTGKDKWIYRISIEGMITMRFGIEVQDRYLVINNLPFSNQLEVTGNAPASNGTIAMQLNPGACVALAPALYSSAAEANRAAAKLGAACLLPMVLAGNESIEAARKQHAGIFGFTPVHPGKGSWSWSADDSELVSSTYASLWTNHQLDFDPEASQTGIFKAVSRADLSMQFEEDGLRTTVSWRIRE